MPSAMRQVYRSLEKLPGQAATQAASRGREMVIPRTPYIVA